MNDADQGVLKRLGKIPPDIRKNVLKFKFGDLHARPGFDLKININHYNFGYFRKHKTILVVSPSLRIKYRYYT
jgi:hypothetical protein